MVRADLGCSGATFSIDTGSGLPRVAVISAAWGLGEPVLQGTVDPDSFPCTARRIAGTGRRPGTGPRPGRTSDA